MSHKERLQALTLTGVNLVVEAGAGTGKTTLLINRLCLCVLAQNIPVEKLVALTFTDKAAAEIKTRFIFKLQQLIELLQAQQTNPPSAEEYETDKKYKTLRLLREKFGVCDADLLARSQCALARLDRACMGTIHSFCAEILKMFPLEAGLSPLAQIDTGQRAAQLFEQHWNRFLDVQLGVHAPQRARWKEVLSVLKLEDLKAFAQQLCALKPVEYNYYSHCDLLAKVCTQKSAQAQAWAQAHWPANNKPRAVESALMWAAQSLKGTAAFLKGDKLPPAPAEPCPLLGNAPKGWEADEFEQARTLIYFAQKITPEHQTLFLKAYELVQPIGQEMRVLYEQEGVLSFDDLIIKTRNLLQHNLYVRRILKEKFEMLFIDEFQDTDPLQGELLLFLAEEKAAAASRWQEVRLLPGKLIVVGDPKQSIYRFRGADITAYELFTDLILKQGGRKCFLQKNYRSTPEIVTLANEVCSRAMVQESAFQPAYVPIFASKLSSGSSAQWLFVRAQENQPIQADDCRQNQAEQIARWICEHVGKLTLANGQKLTHADIALLTRAGTYTRIYTDALRRYRIPFVTQTDKDFFHKQELNDLLLFLQVIADPEDKIALAGVLRSPFGGLTDAELYELASQGKLSLPLLRKEKSTSACVEQLLRFSQLAGRVSLKELIEQIIHDTFLPEVCAVAYDGERTLAYLQQFVNFAQQYQSQQNASLLSFLAEVQLRLKNPGELNLPAADETADAVSLLTVHKAKGLEFPVVILADLSRRETVCGVKAPAHLFSWQYNMYGLRVGPLCDVNLAFLEEEQKKHSRCEEVRILYVALTRAKEKLLLVADERAGAVRATNAFAACGLWPDGQQTQVISTDGTLALPVTYQPYQEPRNFLYHKAAYEQATALCNLQHWQEEYQKRLRAYQNFTSQRAQTPSQLEDFAPLPTSANSAVQLGTVCHHALEILINQPGVDVLQACTQGAKQVGQSALAAPAEALLTAFVHSPIYQTLRACKCLASEMPFVLPLPHGPVQRGIIDALFETAAGDVWVVDYKTDQVAAGQEQTLFEQHYRAQLQVYKQAAEQIFPTKTVRASVVFVRTFAVLDL